LECVVIVCQCKVVTDREVDAAVADGARTVAAACRATGAGQDCGTCIFSIKAIVCQHHRDLAETVAVDGAAS
jgi:bacterioferritin-associated ferredoxin